MNSSVMARPMPRPAPVTRTVDMMVLLAVSVAPTSDVNRSVY
jgi:hypothetical protein